MASASSDWQTDRSTDGQTGIELRAYSSVTRNLMLDSKLNAFKYVYDLKSKTKEFFEMDADIFNVESVIIRGCKWNEPVNNSKCKICP
jgi:hypothetical protein